MSDRATKRRSARKLRERKHSIYYEPESDEDLDVEESDGAQDFGAEPREPEPEPQRPTKRRKVDRRAKPQTRSKAKRGRPESGKPRGLKKRKHPWSKQLATPFKQKEKKLEFKGRSDGRIPAWTSLPIEILRDVFIFASRPIHEQTTTASANATWLMRSARTCRAFAVPALEAYYQAPSLLTNLQPHHLLELLLMPKEKTYIDYRVKVRSLEIDVRRLAYAATGKHRLDLGLLVQGMPQLQHFEILHPVDTPPYRVLNIQRWTYPTNLIQALETSGTKLKSWRWNRDMIPSTGPMDIYTYMSQAHTSKSFEYLERLVVCGFDVHDSSMPPSSEDSASLDASPRAPRLASLVSELRHLKDVTFVSCDLVMEHFLEYLPQTLERLELSNCLEVTSDMLRNYFAISGTHLRELVLNYNPALSLEFLPYLKALCPRLEVLKMDLTYYSERYNYNDAWAMYDQLLTEDEVPTWPVKLRHLELVNLQKWTAQAAQTLFRSLVDDAKDLLDLRHLVIQAHINIPWRDRAGFRDQWIERLNRVYLRNDENPSPHLGSLRQFRLWKEERAEAHAFAGSPDPKSDDEPRTRRRLSHVRVTPRKSSADVELYEDSEPSTQNSRPAARRSTRVAQRTESRNVSTAAEESSSSDSEEQGEGDWRKHLEAFIQGLCQVVDIRIDNQRPRENQYTEANFLDSEPSGDEDWHSGAELSDDGYAW